MSARIARVLVVFLALVAFYGWTRQLRVTADTHLIYLQTRALVLHGDVDLARYTLPEGPIQLAAIERGEHVYCVYGIGISLVTAPIAAPFIYAGAQPQLVHAVASIPFAAGSVILLHLTVGRFLGRRQAVWAAAAYAFATTLWPLATTAYWQIAPMLFFLVAGIAVFVSDRKRSPTWTGLLFGLATLARPTSVLFLAFAGASYLLAPVEGSRLRSVGKYMVGSAGPLLVLLVQNQWIWGNLTTGGATLAGQGFEGDIGKDLFGMSFGWWRGLFVYSPVLLVSAAGLIVCLRDRRRFHIRLLALAGATFAMFLMYATWTTWWGGDSFFGYRYTLDLVPILVILGAAGLSAFSFLWVPSLVLLAASVLTMTAGSLPDVYMGWDARLFPAFDESPLARAWRSMIQSPGPAIGRIAALAGLTALLVWASGAGIRQRAEAGGSSGP